MKVLLLGADQLNPLYSYLIQYGEEVLFRSDKITYQDVLDINPDFIISYNYRHIINKTIIDQYDSSIINLHTSLLPWNKGAHPNFWSFWDNTPKGVTIHYIDEGLDTGDIITQKEIFFKEHETLRSTYETLQREIQQLFFQNWANIKAMQNKRIPQNHSGTYHSMKDIDKIWTRIADQGGWDISINKLLQLKSEFGL